MLEKVKYEVTKAYIDKVYIEQGEKTNVVHEAEVELDTPELRAAFLSIQKANWANPPDLSRDINVNIPGQVSSDTVTGVKFDHLPDEAELKSTILQMAAAKAELDAKAVKAEAEQKAKRARLLELAKPVLAAIVSIETWDDYRSVVVPDELENFKPDEYNSSTVAGLKRKAFNRLESADKETAAKEAEAERAKWIEANGSDRLKRAFAGGYEVGRLYAIERSEIEAPEFDIDFYGEAEWKERTNPTLSELDELDKAKALGLGSRCQIVWLTTPGSKVPVKRDYYDDDWDDFDDCPAIVIREYLGKYDLIKAL